jgi:uncharacterized protein YutE (UPF0331/DUF86 family)
MGWMGLAAAAIWPVVVLVMVLIFRGPLTELLSRLKSAHLPGGAVLRFNDEAPQLPDQVEALASSTLTPALASPIQSSQPSYQRSDGLSQLALLSPQFAINAAYVRLEDILLRLSAPYGQPQSTLIAVKSLSENGEIPEEFVSVLNELILLRNQAVRGPEAEISLQAATAYISSVERMVEILIRIEIDKALEAAKTRISITSWDTPPPDRGAASVGDLVETPGQTDTPRQQETQ